LTKYVEAGLLNKSLWLAPAEGVTNNVMFVTDIICFASHFAVLLKLDLDVQQTHLWHPHHHQPRG